MPTTDVTYSAQPSPPIDVSTPAVVVDVDVLERNITRTAQTFRERGVELRPHAKTHKVVEIAQRQLAAGAVGLTVATISEAEVFADAGVEDVFIAYPLWLDARNAARLRTLAGHCTVRIGVDSTAALDRIASELHGSGIRVSLELDAGHHRSGVLPAEAPGIFAHARRTGVALDGVFTFPGHSYAPGRPAAVAEQEAEVLGETTAMLREAGFMVSHVSGGSTPTAVTGVDSPATEIRPGVYVFFDAQQLELGSCTIEDVALHVVATVVSRHDRAGSDERRIVVNAGSKVLGSDRPAWATGFGRLPQHPRARVTALSEHHGTIVFPDDEPLPQLGAQLRLIPNHVCLTMNLVDRIQVVQDDQVIGSWEIAARGCND
ncbi:D-TA family PLP-dependent enzyme [Kocuria coralli]|uniref:D-TA family PLP-dependent enzyme n=1 Tax=Kocuria coralli TaxID=1461025 RepID=A0A5J5L0M9_9MICC|nr:alanine racemase [Kocuria coralli]KAA9395504.1 D-TA family PLP-dependent enzyme [Kocuria coralli]